MSIDPVTGGGTAERTFQMSRFLSKIGIDCTLLTTDIGVTPELLKRSMGLNLVTMPILHDRFYIPRFTCRQVSKAVADADIVHLMGHWTFINALVYVVARFNKKPYVVCPAGALPIYGRSRVIKKLYNRIIGNKIIRNADGHIATAVNEIEQFQEYGIVANKISLIPNGIDGNDLKEANDADFRKKFGLGDSPFLLFMGRLNSIKGPDLLLRAFCNIKDKLSNYHLVFAGPDEGMLAELKNSASHLGISDRVHFIGYLGGSDKSQAYHASDLLVIPSRQEVMTIVVLEAGITGTPVLMTDKCGFGDVAAIGGGCIVSATIAGLEKGLIDILNDPAELKSMGAKLKKYTYEHFTWDSITKKYLKLYTRILDSISLGGS